MIMHVGKEGYGRHCQVLVGLAVSFIGSSAHLGLTPFPFEEDDSISIFLTELPLMANPGELWAIPRYQVRAQSTKVSVARKSSKAYCFLRTRTKDFWSCRSS